MKLDNLIMEDIENCTLKLEWDKGSTERSYLKERWENYAGWTIPSVFTDDQMGSSYAEQQHDFQSLGAQVVNHLSNKIATVLFQPGRPFFRLDLTDDQLEQLVEQGLKSTEIDELLAHAEKEGMKELSKAKLRTAILAVLKALIVVGNSMLYFPDGKSNVITSQVYSVKDYTIKRDMLGEVTKIITRDIHAVVTLPDDIRELAMQNHDKIEDTDTVQIFTAIVRTSMGKYVVWQELEDIERIPRQIGSYAPKDLPWIPLTWNLSRGHDYGT